MMKSETYQQVTDTITRAIAAGTPPWRKPWRAVDGAASPGFVGRPLRENGQPYRGVNTIVLWEAAMRRGFTSPYWLTYRKAAEIGAQVRKGAKSELAFYVGTYIPADKREKLQEGEEGSAERAFLKAYHVFNASEIDELPAKYAGATIPPAVIAESGRIGAADTFVDATGASVRHGGNRAFYAPSIDAIAMPTFGQFETPAAYYSTLLHELTHWTGADQRLARLEKVKRHGDETYAAEELVAELGASFLCADLGIANETEQAAAYVEGWLKILKDDNRAIFRLASLAERAADYLKATQPAPAIIMLPAPETVIALPAPESDSTVVATLPAPVPAAEPAPSIDSAAAESAMDSDLAALRTMLPTSWSADRCRHHTVTEARLWLFDASGEQIGAIARVDSHWQANAMQHGQPVTLQARDTLAECVVHVCDFYSAVHKAKIELAKPAEPVPAAEPAPASKPAKPRQTTGTANAAAAITVAGFKARKGRKWSVTAAQKAKRTLADAPMPAGPLALESYPPSFQRAYADVMAAGAIKPRDGEHFAHMLGAAKVNAAAVHGSRWAFAHGASVVARIPSRWASIAVHGRTCRLARDQRMPCADFWPGGELPAGLDAITRDATNEPILYGDTNRDASARRRYERDYKSASVDPRQPPPETMAQRLALRAALTRQPSRSRDYLSKPAAEPAPLAEAAD